MITVRLSNIEVAPDHSLAEACPKKARQTRIREALSTLFESLLIGLEANSPQAPHVRELVKIEAHKAHRRWLRLRENPDVESGGPEDNAFRDRWISLRNIGEYLSGEQADKPGELGRPGELDDGPGSEAEAADEAAQLEADFEAAER